MIITMTGFTLVFSAVKTRLTKATPFKSPKRAKLERHAARSSRFTVKQERSRPSGPRAKLDKKANRREENTKRDPHTCDQLTLTKIPRQPNKGKDRLSTNAAGTIGYPCAKKGKPILEGIYKN